MINLGNYLSVGTVLYGYCSGFFGRDSYEEKRVEAVGHDWLICRDESGDIHFGTLNSDGWNPDAEELEKWQRRPIDE